MWYDAPRRIRTVAPAKGTPLLGSVFASYDAERRATLFTTLRVVNGNYNAERRATW